MKILSIETSCDETAVSILEAQGDATDTRFTVLGNALYSQAHKHAEFGGVYPSLAKREHAENLVPLLVSALRDSGMYEAGKCTLPADDKAFIEHTLMREERLARIVLRNLVHLAPPAIDVITVTHGPGLEPALWVGVNFARVLGRIWDKPIMPVNHLEGHLVAGLVAHEPNSTPVGYLLDTVAYPLLGLIVSGGHTEFVYSTRVGAYEKIGGTRDDSIGEAFDKVARMMSLPYPGGLELSRLAEKGRPSLHKHEVLAIPGLKPLPRPMLHSDDLDFSFSGLKTAVKYQIRDISTLTDEARLRIAADFEESVCEVVVAKTESALTHFPTKTFVLGGGVSANNYLRTRLGQLFSSSAYAHIPLRVPADGLSTDNAIMIGMAGYLAHQRGVPTLSSEDDLRANGNLAW